jgi:hypothetical protein
MKRRLLLLAVVIAVALVGAPFLKADRFGPRIQAGLEKALGRKVEIGAVRLHLLTGPGFSVRKVVIHERPEISAEPVAYVDDLVVRLRLLSLLAGRLEFSSLRLDKPHVNLMRRADGVWNVQALLAPPGPPGGGGGEGAPFPELEVRRGRLNFKIDDRKSAYYFTDADIDFSAVGGGNFDIWFVGEMARTDRMARGLGRVTARGRLRDTGGEPKLNLDAQLERSALQELAQLAGSRDLGVHGVVKSRAEISGPVSALEIKGRLEVTELHHWTQPPRAASVSVDYAGSLQLGAQILRLETDKRRPLRVSVELQRFLTQPQWRVTADSQGLSLEGMQEWLRPPGADYNGMKLAGTVDGTIALSSDSPAAGAAKVTGLDWTWGDANRLEATTLEAALEGGAVRLLPTVLELDGQPLQVDCEWTIGELRWECKGNSKGHDVRKLQRWMRALGLRAEWVEDLTAGQLRGTLAVSQAGLEALQWVGQLELRNAELPLPELAQPVKVAAASVVWQHERLAMPALRASAGGVSWSGSYRYEAGAARPHRVALEMDAVELADLERLLGPAWRGSGILSRALGMGAGKEREGAEVTVRARRIGVLDNVRATVGRQGERVSVNGLSGEWRGGKVTGGGVVRIGGDAELSGRLSGVPWEGGVVDSDWKVFGRGPMTATGTVRMTGGLAEWLTAAYRWESAGRLTLTGIEGMVDGKKLTGRVSGPAEGPFMAAVGEAIQIRVSLRPFEVTVAGR